MVMGADYNILQGYMTPQPKLQTRFLSVFRSYEYSAKPLSSISPIRELEVALQRRAFQQNGAKDAAGFVRLIEVSQREG